MAAQLSLLLADWVAHLAAINHAPRTVTLYRQIGKDLLAGIGDQPLDAVTHRQIEAWQGRRLAAGVKASTANISWRVLQQFWKWLVAEGEAETNLIGRVGKPKVVVEPVAVLTREECAALVATCRGHNFRDARDEAILRLFMGTGIRLDELTGLDLGDVDLDGQSVTVMGKGRRPRTVSYGGQVDTALRRYRRYRIEHRLADSVAFWLAPQGRLTRSGIFQLVRDRGNLAGLSHVHPHQLRHTFAHEWMSKGGSETGLMDAAGWKSRTMLNRYAASTAAARSRAEARRLNVGEL